VYNKWQQKNTMKQIKYTEIFKRFYTGLQSKRDETELLESEPVNSMMEEQWAHPEEMKDQVKAPDFDAIFARIEQKAYQETKVRYFPVYRLVAGIALLIGLTAVLYLFFQKDKVVKQLQFATASGEIKSFSLPDGSTLWLGENSRVSYPVNFNDNRVVDMEGLAFFKVIKNNTPFKVNAGMLTVEVTGTSFSVSNYKNAAEIEATLVEGHINITDSKGQLIKQLEPDEKIIFNKASGNYEVMNVNARELTLWKESKLKFNNTSLTDIASELSKRYGIQIQVDGTLATYNFTFTLSDETLEETLSLISSMAPVGASQNGDTVTLSLKK
jgi:ferric-dicitrate binding protein FerR (iron transport regulator)